MGTADLPIREGDERPVLSRPEDSPFRHAIQRVNVSTNLGRETMFELGRRGPYHRYVNYPVEVTADIRVWPAATGCL
jgi:hypothetical protein